MALCEDYQLFRSTGAASGVNGTAEGLTKSVVTNSKIVYNGDSSTSGKTKQSEATLADFRLLRTKPDGSVLARGAYYVHHTYDTLFASFNTGTNLNVYQRMGVGGPSLDGFPIRWTAAMPAYSTTASASLVHALFGDLSYAYLGVRGGPRVDTSREAGFETDEILIRALQRMTTDILAVGAVAGLRNAAS
jgi:HK97 family phage major capsid protein